MSEGSKSARERGEAKPTKQAAARDRRTGFARFVGRANDRWQKLLELPGPWVLLILAVGTWALTPGGFWPQPDAQPGDIADRDWVAPEDLLIPDAETTAQKQQQARSEVPPVYDFDPDAGAELDAALGKLFADGRRMLAAGPDRPRGSRGSSGLPTDVAADLSASTRLEATDEQLAALAARSFGTDLEERMRNLASQALRQGLVEGKERLLENRLGGVTLRNLATGDEQRHYDLYDHLDFPVEARELLEGRVSDWRELSASQRRLVVEFLIANLEPNLSLNQRETRERQQSAADATPPVFEQVRKGQVVVRKGDEIDVSAARLIREITGETGDWKIFERMLPVLGTFALLALSLALLWYGLRNERVVAHSRERIFCEVVLLFLVALLGTKLSFVISTALASTFDTDPFGSFRSYAYGVPFAGIALVGILLFGRQAATLLALVFSVLVSRLAGVDALWITLYSLIGCLAAVYAAERTQFKQRLIMLRLGFVVAMFNIVAVLILTALSGSFDAGLMQVAFDVLCALAGGFLVAAVASFALPILESLLGITTDIKLVELANTNLPLLRRLAFEAPGTFQHSMMVANLAKEGCEAIGADPVLAHTGGLYHDVGKMNRPEYFIENQIAGRNPHDKLNPSMSALVLINHVKEGLGLAREHHLPQVLRDAIAQHHGTRLITYFYKRAQERADDPDEVTESEYRYPGPKPQTKVMGVLMLADGVEAASRTLAEPTTPRIRLLIQKIVDDCLEDGQLDECDLTLSDLRRVSDSFLRVLTRIYHQRIDYPGFDFNGDQTGSGRRRKKTSGTQDVARAVEAARGDTPIAPGREERPERSGDGDPSGGEEPEGGADRPEAAAGGRR